MFAVTTVRIFWERCASCTTFTCIYIFELKFTKHKNIEFRNS